MQIYSFSPFGYEGSLVSVEVDLRRGIPAVDIVGLADGAVKESRERMRSAIRNCGFDFPPERVLISLAPADLRKEGAGFDLAVALAVLCEKDCTDGQGDGLLEGKLLVMGELELNGRVRPVKGIHAAASTAREGGICRCIVPEENADEAREIEGMEVCGASSLLEAYAALTDAARFHGKTAGSDGGTGTGGAGSGGAGAGGTGSGGTAGHAAGGTGGTTGGTTGPGAAAGTGGAAGHTADGAGAAAGTGTAASCVDIGGVLFPPVEAGYEFSDIRGQDFFVRGLQLAAAGGHNVLAFGPPGCGKTLALQKFPALLPLLSTEEARPVTRIYSLAGLLPRDSSLIRTAPFRQPHQTASIEGMCGGGPRCTPGEISLAHNGVLFLDEAAEFKTSVLQMLRVPLESGLVTLSRAGRSTVFPASFQLLLATNPCPCGNFGSNDRICLCSAHAVSQYWKKFSAPLLDRIDIRVQVQKQAGGAISGGPDNMSIAGSTDSTGSAGSEGGPRTGAISGGRKPLTTAELREGIARAVLMQRKRQGKKNAKLTPSEIPCYCPLEDEAEALLAAAGSRLSFSPRSIASCIKLARTVADMKGEERITAESMKTALSYRQAGGLAEELGML